MDDALKLVGYGAGEILLTSMDRDGVKSGYDLDLTRAVSDAVDVPVIASGGWATLQHLVDGVTEGHASAVLAATIFHFGELGIARSKNGACWHRQCRFGPFNWGVKIETSRNCRLASRH